MPFTPQIDGVSYDPNLPVLEREQLEMLLMADDDEDGLEIIREIFEIFCRESSEKFSGLDAACLEGDQTTLRKMVHFVAGSAGNLGLSRMCGFYRAIEQAIDTGTLVDLSQCAEPIRKEFEYGCEVFQQDLGL